MKRFLPIVLLLIFSFNLSTYFIIYKIQQYQIKKEIAANIRKGIPEEALSILDISGEQAKDLRWEGSKEFEYEGNWYDIVKMQSLKTGAKRYYCIADTRETNLIKEFHTYLQKNHKQKKWQQNLTKHFKIVPEAFADYSFYELKITIKNNFKIFVPYKEPELGLSVPPPRLS